jgi:tetratricopeptide (TPR) repeat protein
MKGTLPFLVLFLISLVPSMAAKEKEIEVRPEKLAEANQLSRKADSLLARKYYDDAILEYRKVLAINPLDYVVQNKLGIAYHQLMNLNLAKKQYEQAKKINPRYAEAWNNLGTVHYSLKKYKRAVKNYKKSLELQPQSATAYHNMGAAYFGMQKYEEGFAAYLQAYRLDPTILERNSTYGTIIKTSEFNEAMQNFYMAKLYALNGQQDKALSFLLKALENGFKDFDKITKDPALKLLAQNERVVKFMESPATAF